MADNKIASLWEQAAQGEGWPRSQPALGMASEPRAGQEPLFSATQRRTREHEIHFEHCSPCRAASKGCFGLATVRSCILMFKMSGNNFFFFLLFPIIHRIFVFHQCHLKNPAKELDSCRHWSLQSLQRKTDVKITEKHFSVHLQAP